MWHQEPHDLITLDASNSRTTLKTFPLKLPKRRVPDKPDGADEIEVRLIDRPEQLFTVQWQFISRVRLFEPRVLAEAEKLVEAGRYDEAYDYYHFLENKFPDTIGLKDAVERYLWVQILDAYKGQRHSQALALLVELHRRSPDRKGLATAYEQVTGKLFEQCIAQQRYKAARSLVNNLAEKYPESAAASVSQWQTQLEQQAKLILAEAQAQVRAGKLREAQQTCSRLLEVWPTIDGGQELSRAIDRQYPRIVVGVTSLPAAARGALDDWADRRSSRLLARELCELSGAEQAGKYVSPLASLERSADGAQLSLVIRTGLRWPGGRREVAAHDVASLLIARTNRSSSAFDPAWTEVVQSVSTEGVYGVRVEFQQPQVSPEAWLQIPLGAADSASRSAPALGPFLLEQQTPREAHYLAQTGSFQPQAGGAKELVERVYLDPGLALRALKRGDVSAVDRINPWEVAAARATPDIVVEPYAAPVVHLLVPNQRKPLLASRAFRRALSLGLDRAAILERALLGGKSVPGSSLISGPFPKPASADDPRGAAYDTRIETRGYDPSQSLLLAGLGLQEVTLSEKKRGHAFKPLQKLTLAYPPHETARVACQSIVRQWRLVGVQIALRELQPGEALGTGWDLAYVELRMTEPVVDVWRLFGPEAIAGGASPTIALAMQELRQASDVAAASAKLREIHGWVDRETALIPLWQLVDHLAYQQNLRGVGQRPATLYQNVEQWRQTRD